MLETTNNYIKKILIYYMNTMNKFEDNIEWNRKKTLLNHLKPECQESIEWLNDF
jgi:Ca2+-dependent lipid-binding protein